MLSPAPDFFEGRISELVEMVVAPSFPAADALVAWTEALLSYYGSADPICIVRGLRKGELYRHGTLRVVHSDNAPGIWTFLRAIDGTFQVENLERALEGGEVPVLKMLVGPSNRNWEWNYAT